MRARGNRSTCYPANQVNQQTFSNSIFNTRTENLAGAFLKVSVCEVWRPTPIMLGEFILHGSSLGALNTGTSLRQEPISSENKTFVLFISFWLEFMLSTWEHEMVNRWWERLWLKHFSRENYPATRRPLQSVWPDICGWVSWCSERAGGRPRQRGCSRDLSRGPASSAASDLSSFSPSPYQSSSLCYSSYISC